MRSFADARLGLVAIALALQGSLVLAQSSGAAPKTTYQAIHAREDVVRRGLDSGNASAPLLRRIRNVVGEYERMSKAYRQSGYSDNALYQAAMLSADAYWSFGEETDRTAALRLFGSLGDRFPSSSLNRQIESQVSRLESANRRAKSVPPTSDPAGNLRPRQRALTTLATSDPRGRDGAAPVSLKSIRRESLPDALRVTLELDREISFHDERLDGPPRVFVDLKHASPASPLRDATLAFPDDVVRTVRVGRPQGDTTRVVFDLQGVARHSVYVLYEPYRLVIDFERTTKEAKAVPGATWTPEPLTLRSRSIAATSTLVASPHAAPRVMTPAPVAAAAVPAPLPTIAVPAAPPPPAVSTLLASHPSAERGEATPTPPAANMRGGFSLSRQLGLSISRIVIDAGHGGHDPGAQIRGLNEADLVLDVALRLEKLLKDQHGVAVTLTRKSNVYIPLEQRTAIANRDEADLFLSIHANASENEKARGIETYFLNFAPNPEAEKIAARENSGGSKTMHSLPEIVKAIALNNKIDESRDFASLIQGSMFERLKKTNEELKDLGVKQAPFMVLIGAQMPSVLAEISFITNKDEGTLLKTPAYRQQIADALLAGIMKYQKAVKATQTIAKH